MPAREQPYQSRHHEQPPPRSVYEVDSDSAHRDNTYRSDSGSPSPGTYNGQGFYEQDGAYDPYRAFF
jgi:hypothetical protein